MDIDIDMTNCIRNQHTEDIAINLIQQWKKECQVAEERTKVRFTQKEKWFKENWNFERKPRIDEENITNLQQHKGMESGSRKPNKIPRDFFELRKRKSEEETNRNIRSSSERLNITNDPLLLVLIVCITETAATIEKTTLQRNQQKLIFQRNFKVTQEEHDVFQTGKNKKIEKF